MTFDYTNIAAMNVWRPYVFGALLNRSDHRMTLAVPMVIDTGSDRCLFNVALALAHEIGINPVEGGVLSGTTGVGGRVTTAVWPIEVAFPQLKQSFEIHAEFTNALPSGVHGLLGHLGFLDRFSKICFLPRRRQFSIEV